MLPETEPCEECRAAERVFYQPGAPTVAEVFQNRLAALAQAAERIHGGSAGREYAAHYEHARAVLRRVWG
jgi:hypothetical protein